MPATVAESFDVTLTSGDATVVVTVVPTPIDDVDSVVVAVRDSGDLAAGDKTAVIALVAAGDQPVFGAPVTWTIDDVNVADDDGVARPGDALEVAFQPGTSALINARLGPREVPVQIETDGSDLNVTSITAACGAVGGPLMVVLLVLGVRTRRKRLQRTQHEAPCAPRAPR